MLLYDTNLSFQHYWGIDMKFKVVFQSKGSQTHILCVQSKKSMLFCHILSKYAYFTPYLEISNFYCKLSIVSR